jgi:hypothetical protein
MGGDIPRKHRPIAYTDSLSRKCTLTASTNRPVAVTSGITRF